LLCSFEAGNFFFRAAVFYETRAVRLGAEGGSLEYPHAFDFKNKILLMFLPKTTGLAEEKKKHCHAGLQ
jgi:hypothetical protein